MDVPARTSSKNLPAAHNTFPTHGNPRALSFGRGEESHRASTSGVRSERTLRREHSDGEVYGTTTDALVRRRGFHDSPFSSDPIRPVAAPQNGTWNTGFEQAVAGRREIAAQLLADRKKRREDYARRQSASSLPSGSLETPRLDLSSTTSEHPLSAASGLLEHSFPPGDLNRPLPRRPNERYPSAPRSREITLPRWQPDVEVNECPICHTTFSFFYRKHHCRKCGRVVCANCSPHRITIPRQFIVHPPDDAVPSPESTGNAGHTVVDLTSEDESPRVSTDSVERPRTADYKIDPALGGGQEVRLCNPCVPDPNPMPPPSYYSLGRSSNPLILPDRISNHGRSSRFNEGIPTNSPPSLINRRSSGRANHRPRHGHNFDANVSPRLLATRPPEASSAWDRRYLHQSHPAFLPSNLPTAYGSAPDSSAQERFLEGLNQCRRPSHPPHHRQHASLGSPAPSRSRLPWSQDLEAPAPRLTPQPQLREEDECPICHGVLPPKGTDGSETAREAHVNSCIETHFSAPNPRSVQLYPPAATTATPSQSGGATNYRDSESSLHDRPTSAFFQQRRRTTGMVVYNATEKDCIGEDGSEAECVICFEEFLVGDEMGRLECLCKFHKVFHFSLNDARDGKRY